MGGDRATLTPGRHVVENCRIHAFGRLDRTYTPAIQLEGVGHRVAHNLMYDCPSSVLRVEGNDHVIEYNEVRDAVQESDDQGAMELFLNPTYRGVVFRYNLFVDVGKTGTEKAVHGQAAIRLDDAISGVEVYGNVFVRSANGHFGAVQLNSGRDNVIDNNLFIACRQGVSGGYHAGNVVWQWLRDGQVPPDFHLDERYLTRYPELAFLLAEPGINHLWRNVFCDCGRPIAGREESFARLASVTLAGAAAAELQAAVDARSVWPAIPALAAAGFCPLPLAHIGLYADEFCAPATTGRPDCRAAD